MFLNNKFLDVTKNDDEIIIGREMEQPTLEYLTYIADKYAKIIHDELNKLGLEFSRYKERWDKLTRSIETVNKDIESVSITTNKISKKFETINKVDMKSLTTEEKDYD